MDEKALFEVIQGPARDGWNRIGVPRGSIVEGVAGVPGAVPYVRVLVAATDREMGSDGRCTWKPSVLRALNDPAREMLASIDG